MKTLLATTAIIAASLAGAASADKLSDAINKIDMAYAGFDSAAVPTDVVNELKDLAYKIENHNAVIGIDFSALTQDTDGLYTLPPVVINKNDFTNEIATHSGNVVSMINDDMFGTAGVNPAKDFADIKIISPTINGTADWSVEGDGLVGTKLRGEILVDLNKIQDGLDTFTYSAASLKNVLDGVDELKANVVVFNSAVEALNTTEADVIVGGGSNYEYANRTDAFDVATDATPSVSYRSEVSRASTDSLVDTYVAN